MATKGKRRSAEDARLHILDAAARVFSRMSPDRASLRDVALEADVSQALVSHYFGTYDALVEQTLIHRLAENRLRIMKRLAATGALPQFRELIVGLAEAADDPATLRMTAWALIVGRFDKDQGMGGQTTQIPLVVDVMARAWQRHAGTPVSRDDLEFALFGALFMIYGWRVARKAFSSAVGKVATAEGDIEYRTRVIDMVELYLRSRAKNAG